MYDRVYKRMLKAYSSLHDNGWGQRYGTAKNIRPP